MEAAFPYEETVDQLRSTAEVKADLERGRPMDRLVVGDVGYGKTEVALRAAFKAISDGMQVAVLVPTTVLAAQHLETFRQRFAAYPFGVRMLSRFVSADQQREIIAGLAAGSVDLIIGTHRLLSKDIRFKNLGLVIVDEEQRFGVAHKERLKQLRTEVHVLTLSATPIPRTLNLALAGVRDMSVIETPPEDRLPIQTRVAEASAGLVRDAILRELDRGGQVFFVHNRVETIEAQAEQLRSLLPQARIVIAHGQMAEGSLEKVMIAFARGEYDVLVCTTIIESGLDIPNANTIVIDRADALGLAQLYQLRGRVGRSSRRAYAYLLYRKRGQLSEIARKRLQAIFNASELGAGFQIALSDLEIRGAGNILGGEQHGHLAAVGFDLYTRLLSDAVEEQRAVRDMREPVKPRPQTVIDLPIDAYLPDDYVAEEPQKLELYRRLGRAATSGEVAAIQAELVDRFGAVPGPVERLLEVARLRITAEAAGVVSLAREGHELIVRFHADWSRSATMRAMAPTSPADRIPGVPVGGTELWLEPDACPPRARSGSGVGDDARDRRAPRHAPRESRRLGSGASRGAGLPIARFRIFIGCAQELEDVVVLVGLGQPIRRIEHDLVRLVARYRQVEAERDDVLAAGVDAAEDGLILGVAETSDLDREPSRPVGARVLDGDVEIDVVAGRRIVGMRSDLIAVDGDVDVGRLGRRRIGRGPRSSRRPRGLRLVGRCFDGRGRCRGETLGGASGTGLDRWRQLAGSHRRAGSHRHTRDSDDAHRDQPQRMPETRHSATPRERFRQTLVRSPPSRPPCGHACRIALAGAPGCSV